VHAEQLYPELAALHVVLEGRGRVLVAGTEHDVEPGTVHYQGPGIASRFLPAPNQPLSYVSIFTSPEAPMGAPAPGRASTKAGEVLWRSARWRTLAG
jgi:hypothetical protein